MNKNTQFLNVHWDGPAKAKIVAASAESVTLQRVVEIKGGHLPFGDEITITREELASLARN